MTYLETTAYMFIYILAAMLIALLTGWLGIHIAKYLNLWDIPGTASHKQHRSPVPYAGGIALMLALIVYAVFFQPKQNGEVFFVLLAGLIIFGFGLWDDHHSLKAWIKFLGQMAASLVLIFAGIHIRLFDSFGFPFGAHSLLNSWLDYGLTLVWLVGVTNAFNLVDSMDGLAVGLSGWALGFFMLATYDSGQIGLSAYSAFLLGVCIVLYFYNLNPAKLFLGDSGAQTLGFLLAAIGILYSPGRAAAEQASSWFVPILLVGIPIFDTTLVTISRLRRGLPFYKGRRDHTCHRLVHWGVSPPRAVMAMHICAVLLECTAFIAFSLPPFWANLLFGIILAIGVITLFLMDNRKYWKIEDGN